MKTIQKTLLIAAAAALFSSCGTSIQMTEAIPARVSLGRGTTIYINPRPYNNTSADLERHINGKILHDGYYTLPGYANASRSNTALMNINVSTGTSSGIPYLSADTYLYKYGRAVYSREFVSTGYKDNQGRIHLDSAKRSIANKLMKDLTPHEKNFYVRVKGNSKNPDIDKGARACRAGNWELGEAHALQAIKVNPQDSEAYFLLGIIERQKLNYAKSSRYFQQAYSLKPYGKYQTAISKNKVMQQNDKYVQQQL